MKITVNNLKKLVKRIVRPDENSGKEKDTFEAALKRARDEAKYNLTEELREKYADFLDSPIKEKCILRGIWGQRHDLQPSCHFQVFADPDRISGVSPCLGH